MSPPPARRGADGVLLALTGEDAAIVRALDAAGSGLRVVRRCGDVAELLGAALAGLARLAVLDTGFDDLDRTVLDRLERCGVAGVLLVDDDEARRWAAAGWPTMPRRVDPAMLRARLQLIARRGGGQGAPALPPAGPRTAAASDSASADRAAVERLERLRAELADASERLAALGARWEAEKAGHNRVGELRAALDELRTRADLAEREGSFEEAGRLRYGEMPALEKQIRDAEAGERAAASIVGPDGVERAAAEPMIAEKVGPVEIAEVVESWTGIPVGKLLAGEQDKLLQMERVIGERLIGQRAAVAAVADAVRRSRAGVADPDRPTGSFLFLGPTGVGKTELAKALADFLFDDERAMVRIDMSEYSEKHAVARLVGAPPGYVGYEEGGQLTEAVRRRPYSVVLLDEVEKAHPEVFDILLQVLDDGRLTDGQGRTVDFRNVILVLTSNLGSQFLIDPLLSPEEKRKEVMAQVRAAFKPEFLNRLDDILVFDALTKEELGRIVEIQLARMQQRLADHRLTLTVTDAARAWLADEGYDPAYGARPLRRLVQREIGDRLARMILGGEVLDGQEVVVDVVSEGEGTGLVLTARGEAWAPSATSAA